MERLPSFTTCGMEAKLESSKNEVRDRARRVAAGSHRNAAIGLFQRQNVVHTVARHRHRVAVVF